MPPKWNIRYTTSSVWVSDGSLSLIFFPPQSAATALLLMFYLVQWGWGNPFSSQDAIRQFWNFFANVLKCSHYPAHSGHFLSLVYCCLLFIYKLIDSCDRCLEIILGLIHLEPHCCGLMGAFAYSNLVSFFSSDTLMPETWMDRHSVRIMAACISAGVRTIISESDIAFCWPSSGKCYH